METGSLALVCNTMDMKIIVLLKGSWCLEKTDFYQIIRQLKAKTTSSVSVRKEKTIRLPRPGAGT